MSWHERLRVLVAGAAVAAVAVVSAPAMTAMAAEVDVTISSYSVSPASVGVFDNVTLGFDFRVPDAAVSGDTATFTVPPQLQENQLPAVLALRDNGGNLVANVTFTGADPATMVFTFTDYVDTNTNVGESFTFSATLDDDVDRPSTQTLTLTENDG